MRGRVDRGESVRPSNATFAEVAEAWLAGQADLCAEDGARLPLGARRSLVPGVWAQAGAGGHAGGRGGAAGEDRSSYSPHTVRAVLTPLSRILAQAERRGMIASNPCARLDRGERPRLSRRQVRVLSRDEMALLLGKAEKRYRPFLATAMFSGLRLGELLALEWREIDFEREVIHVSGQLSGKAERVAPKTPQAVRDVILMPALARVLREAKAASRFSQPHDFVFASATGRPLDGRNVAQRGLQAAAEAAGLVPPRPKKGEARRAALDGQRERLTMHELRHCFASLLIAQGEDVTFVSSQLGHANPAITLRVYAHLFEHARHATERGTRLRPPMETCLKRLPVPTDPRWFPARAETWYRCRPGHTGNWRERLPGRLPCRRSRVRAPSSASLKPPGHGGFSFLGGKFQRLGRPDSKPSVSRQGAPF